MLNLSDQRRILLAVMITCFLGPFMASSINVAIPSMAASFNLPPEGLTWTVTAFLIGSAATLLPFGRLADIYGRKKIYRIGLICTCFMTLIAGFITNYPVFLALRFLQGLSISMIFGTSMALLVSCYPADKRGKIIGLASASVYSGLSVGPFLGGFITYYLEWRIIFFFTALALLINIFLLAGIKEEWYGARGKPFDSIGALLSSLLIVLLLYSFSTWSTQSYLHYLLLISASLLVIFIYYQRRLEYPLIQVSLFTNKVFAFTNIAALIHYSATFGLGFIISLYLQVIRGINPATTGLILLIQPLLMAVGSPLTGSLSDKYPPRLLAAAGMFIMALGLLYFHFMTPQTSLTLIGINLAVIGLGFALFAAPNNNAIMGAVEPRLYGIASSILAVMRLIGQASSMALVTLFIDNLSIHPLDHNYQLSLLHCFSTLFIIFSFLCVLGLICSLIYQRSRPPIKL